MRYDTIQNGHYELEQPNSWIFIGDKHGAMVCDGKSYLCGCYFYRTYLNIRKCFPTRQSGPSMVICYRSSSLLDLYFILQTSAASHSCYGIRRYPTKSCASRCAQQDKNMYGVAIKVRARCEVLIFLIVGAPRLKLLSCCLPTKKVMYNL